VPKLRTKEITERPSTPRALFDPRRAYSRVEAAAVYGVHPKSIGRWDAQGKIKDRVSVGHQIVRYPGAGLNRDLCGVEDESAA
jgi:hypothetical protein